jgi:hypothetical protein
MSYPYNESSVYLRHIVKTYAEEGSPRGGFPVREVFLEWPKLELEKRGEGVYPLIQSRLEKSLNMINTRVDCADFVLPAFLSMLYLYRDSELLSRENREIFKQAALGYKYAMDDPNEDKNGVCYFTENHQILFAACEYIAGQLFPDEIFSNNNWKGSRHRDRGEQRVRQWIDWRARLGYSEWLSNGYYSEDLLALAIVYGLSEKEDLRKEAGKLIELTIFDIAVNSYNGLLGASSGRAYVSPTTRPELAATSSIAKMYWGEGSYEAVALGTVALAVFDYQCSEAVKNVGRDRSTVINRERMSINVEDSKKYGLDPHNYKDIMFYWGQQTFLHRDVIENSMKLCPLWLGMRPSIDAHWEKYQILEKAGFTPAVIDPLLQNSLVEGKSYDPDLACCALTQTDIYTYKTAYYNLSNSQDFRKAKVGYQQHIWQASLGDRAVVFTNCQGSNEYRDRPNQFAGNKFMPRTVQHKNVLLCIYRIPTESAHFFFTHLYFPQREFDQVREEGGWIFGKRGGAYIAVYSSIKGKWQRLDPELYKVLFPQNWEEEFKSAKPWEYLVPKHAVVYVCEMGDEKTNGSFDDFTESFRNVAFTGDTFKFTYSSPSLGKMSFGWAEPFKVKDEEIAIHGYKRYDNPYCQAEFGQKTYRISCGGEEVKLDFKG